MGVDWHRAFSWALALIVVIIVVAYAGTALQVAMIQPSDLGELTGQVQMLMVVGIVFLTSVNVIMNLHSGLAARTNAKATTAVQDRHRLGLIVGLMGSVTDVVGATGTIRSALPGDHRPSRPQSEALLETVRAARRAVEKVRYGLPDLHGEAAAVSEALAEVQAAALGPHVSAADLGERVRVLQEMSHDLVRSADYKI